MIPALSTRWNTFRHGSGEAMVDEILGLGIRDIELGYDLTLDLVPGVQQRVRTGAVRVVSIHNFCPVPVGAPHGHPELFPLATPDEAQRTRAVQYTQKTIAFAGEMGAEVVVVHAGSIRMRDRTGKLVRLAEAGKRETAKYDKIRTRLILRREKLAARYLDSLYRSCEELIPCLESAGVRMGIENLPYWESVPTPPEMDRLLTHFDSPRITYWHDIGHGQICQNLQLVSTVHWFRTLLPRLSGIHVHDVAGVARDHLMPPAGNVDFSNFRVAPDQKILYVLEPAPGTEPEHIRAACRHLAGVWEQTNPKGRSA